MPKVTKKKKQTYKEMMASIIKAKPSKEVVDIEKVKANVGGGVAQKVDKI
tara:strand:+ start:745 stop:894 length:150 start_codon:yes stop_codon:yes gene_type:complete